MRVKWRTETEKGEMDGAESGWDGMGWAGERGMEVEEWQGKCVSFDKPHQRPERCCAVLSNLRALRVAQRTPSQHTQGGEGRGGNEGGGEKEVPLEA